MKKAITLAFIILIMLTAMFAVSAEASTVTEENDIVCAESVTDVDSGFDL